MLCTSPNIGRSQIPHNVDETNGQSRLILTRDTKLIWFNEKAFPNVYKWTSYGLTVLLEKIWSKASPLLASKRPVDPLWIELTSVVERALNFMHTGHGKVLATSVMGPLWTSLALIDHGLPAFSPTIRAGLTMEDDLSVVEEEWPFNPATHQPLSASKRSQILTYGLSHYSVSPNSIFYLCRASSTFDPRTSTMCECHLSSASPRPEHARSACYLTFQHR